MANNFSIKDNNLYINDEQIRLFAGSMHYFRIHPAYWEDRILKLKSMGCNAVETYVAWNVHEPEQGEWTFEGFADLEGFIKLTQKHDLHLLIRFSPYICAEWENGGMPYWLLKDRNVRLRSRDPKFMTAVESYYDHILDVIKPHFSTNGGNIIATQLENEYGCTQNDKQYLEAHRDMLLEKGVDIPMINCVWSDQRPINAGQLDGTFLSLNFRDGAKQKFELLEQMDPNAPRICSEFWVGWFSAWGGAREKPPAKPEEIAHDLDALFSEQGHPILYMFHGGTNFGFMNGSNIREDYTKYTITSYDYEAPLSESGQITEYFKQMKEVAVKHGFEAPAYESKIALPVAYPSIPVKQQAPLFSQLNEICTSIASPYPLTMEECDQGYGYILYRTTVTGPGWNDRLFINELRDRAHIFVDGEYLETIQRDRGRFVGQTEKTFDVKPEGTQLDILVENQGRANFAPFMQEYRGITENVFLNDSFVLSNWEHYPLKMDNLENLAWEANDDSIQEKSPAFFKANLKLDGEPCDTYIYPKDWHKGFITVNGFNIGRYWNIGPQYSLYIPAPLLKKSDNEIIIFEEEKPGKEIHFSEKLITDF